VEYRIRTRDGGYRWFHDIGRISAYGPDSKPLKVTGLVIDITGRKRAEAAQEKTTRKLNVLSDLTRKDLTSQVFVLSGYLNLAKKHADDQDQVITTLSKGEQALRSIHEIIEYTKDYQDMGIKPATWQSVNLALLFGLSHVSIGEIRHSLETGNLEIFADPLLEKVCQRLFENSLAHGGHVTRIRIWHTKTPEGITIFFEDDGIGISAEKKEQIFMRGEGATRFSMRSLIFVREILDITGITIRETGEPGKGARFEMTVPNGAWRFAGKGD
jgi:signal transduction histidine kinase